MCSNRTVNLIEFKNVYKKYTGEVIKKIPIELNEFALKNINFQISKGECLGIIGVNGSGKSTILKLITGTLKESYGLININCSIHALIELGIGLDNKQSGLSNLDFFLRMHDLDNESRKLFSKKISEFSELEEKLLQNVETYSSGMFVRLAYSMNALLPCDVLIIDEALAVGDARFQHKCFTHIKELIKSGVTVIFVSHSMEQIRQLCTRVLFIDNGYIKYDGDTNLGCDLYYSSLFGTNELNNNIENPASEEIYKELIKLSNHPLFNKNSTIIYGDKRAEITAVSVIVDNKEITSSIKENYKSIKIKCQIKNDLNLNLIFGITIKSKQGAIIFGTNNFIDNIVLSDTSEENYIITFEILNVMSPGFYFIDLGIAEQNYTDGGNPVYVAQSCIIIEIISGRKYLSAGIIKPLVNYHLEIIK